VSLKMSGACYVMNFRFVFTIFDFIAWHGGVCIEIGPSRKQGV
jgi:hypothetical protein